MISRANFFVSSFDARERSIKPVAYRFLLLPRISFLEIILQKEVR